ncbi:hypothetical protein Lalb_Chr25g0281591 [Lupinus albus]|uniref:Replication protein A 70 kDa DNA-binding subunit B/D first OB fold domain-containing protein n=1 Tax=Lupinus albus TaxID=3870 RepID=A0A6A4NBU7_LUPAL|nr:hypothetical protein Lalb_Chr25g0281591 [Lupinus albus]
MSLSRPYDFIMDLNDAKQFWKIAVRITQIWYVQIPPKPGHLEMILIDSKVTQNFISSVNLFEFIYLLKHFISYLKGDKIQVSVRKDEFNQWSQCFLENNTYVMHNFNVMRNDLQYKACDHVYRMQFTPGTTLKQREFPDIPELEYDFKKFSDILFGNFRSDLLIEVIGVFDKLIFSQTQSNLKKVIFTIKDFWYFLFLFQFLKLGDVISCTLWETHAMNFFNYFNNQPIVQPLIILLTNARVKEGQGDVNNTSCRVLDVIYYVKLHDDSIYFHCFF